MSWAMLAPLIYESPCAWREAVAAVRVADFENRSRHGFALGVYEFQQPGILGHREHGNRPMPHAHFHGKPAAGLAVINAQRAHFGPAFGDAAMAGPVVSHKHHIVLVIDRVELGERPGGSESIHDLHGLDVLDFHFACHRTARRTRSEERRVGKECRSRWSPY